MKVLFTIIKDIFRVWKNEFRLVFSDAGALIFVLFLPVAYPIVYSLIYNREVVKDVPIAIVDDCRTPMSREYARMLDATELVRVEYYAANMQEAKEKMHRDEVYGIVRLPKEFSRNVGRGEQATAEVYCDMSVILRYKNILSAVTTVNSELGSHVQMSKITQLGNAPEAHAMPIPYRIIPVGNTAMGMASALLPGILALILQQSFVMCIVLVMASSRERRIKNGGHDPKSVEAGALATLLGKALCYFVLMIAPTIFLWRLVPIIFSFPQNGDVMHTMLLAVPYIFAIIFMGMSLQTLVRKREAVFAVVVVTSVFFLFLSGISWPRYAMSGFWTLVGDIIPSTWAVQAVSGIGGVGATLSQQSEAYLALWILTGVYFMISYFVLRFVDRIQPR